MKARFFWAAGGAVVLAVAVAALVLSIVALMQGTPDPDLAQHTHDVPQHEHEVPDHPHELLDMLSAILFESDVPADGEGVVGSPEDEAYVRQLCLAGFAFNASAPADDLDENSLAEMAPSYLAPLRDRVVDLHETEAPGDVAGYHAAVVAGVEELVDLLEGVAAAGVASPQERARFTEILNSQLSPVLPNRVVERLPRTQKACRSVKDRSSCWAS